MHFSCPLRLHYTADPDNDTCSEYSKKEWGIQEMVENDFFLL